WSGARRRAGCYVPPTQDRDRNARFAPRRSRREASRQETSKLPLALFRETSAHLPVTFTPSRLHRDSTPGLVYQAKYEDAKWPVPCLGVANLEVRIGRKSLAPKYAGNAFLCHVTRQEPWRSGVLWSISMS